MDAYILLLKRNYRPKVTSITSKLFYLCSLKRVLDPYFTTHILVQFLVMIERKETLVKCQQPISRNSHIYY